MVNRAAGDFEIKEARRAFGGIATGDAKWTPSFGHSRVKFIIHAVGPVYRSNALNRSCSVEEKDSLLASAYRSALARAVELGATTVGFCLLSAGVFRGDRSLADLALIALRSLAGGAQPPLAEISVFAYTQEEEAALLADWLSGLRGTKVRFHVPQKGEKVELLAMAQENARLALERKFEPARLNEAVLEGLQAFLGLSHLPRRLECFDISHGQGREVVASCVVFSDGVPDKARYRRFKMTNEQNDDFANMQEAVTRRYKRMRDEGQEFPNLVIIDGGLGQLHAAETALGELGLEQLELASLAKKEELVFRPGSSEPLKIPKSSPVLQLLQRIREEAHRFAVTYHRALRAKRTLQTELTQIPGVGPATARKLLQGFGSAAMVREASEADLTGAVGAAAARKVLAWRQAPTEQPR